MDKKYNVAIRESNVLAGAIKKMNSQQRKIFYLCISRYDAETNSMNFSESEIINALEISKGGKSKKILHDSITSIVHSIIEKEDDKGVLFEVVFTKAYWDKENKMIAFKFNEDLKPHLITTREYTAPMLDSFLKLDKNASILYELLKRAFSDKCHEIYFSIESLRKHFCLGEKNKRVTDFVDRIIEPAVNNINDKTEIKIEFKLILDIDDKRKITKIKFNEIYKSVPEKNIDNDILKEIQTLLGRKNLYPSEKELINEWLTFTTKYWIIPSIIIAKRNSAKTLKYVDKVLRNEILKDLKRKSNNQTNSEYSYDWISENPNSIKNATQAEEPGKIIDITEDNLIHHEPSPTEEEVLMNVFPCEEYFKMLTKGKTLSPAEKEQIEQFEKKSGLPSSVINAILRHSIKKNHSKLVINDIEYWISIMQLKKTKDSQEAIEIINELSKQH